ncbi:MAG: c-type cytochrome [Thiobacillus sp.]
MASVSSHAYAAGDPGRGAAVFNGTCIACHGSDGSGSLPGVPDLIGNNGLLSQDDTVLLKRMTEGFQSPGAAMAMPPRGGDPGLTDADMQAVLNYMRKEFRIAP